MAQKKERQTTIKNSKIATITSLKCSKKEDIGILNNSFVTKEEVFPPKKNNYNFSKNIRKFKISFNYTYVIDSIF